MDPHHEAVAHPWRRDVVVVAGPDATDYLQGQLSQDLAPMAIGTSAWTFALAPTGKVDAWFRVSRRPDEWILDVDAGFGPALVSRLSRFLLRTDAAIEPADWEVVAVRGPGAIASVPADGAAVMADPAWPGIEGVDLLGLSVERPPALPWGAAADLEALRIEAGVPAMGRELEASTIPAATGVVERSVSFAKGCFTGQELVARIHSRGGTAPTRLCGLSGPPTSVVEPGSTLTVDGEPVGSATSVAPSPWREASVGLAYVKRATAVPVAAEADPGGSVTLVPLPLG